MDNYTHKMEAALVQIEDYAPRQSDTLQALAADIVSGARLALATPAHGTMRAWMEANNGRTVHTVQVPREHGRLWVPVNRPIDAGKAGKVYLGDSARDYAGMRVIGVTDSALVVADEFHVIAYVLAGSAL